MSETTSVARRPRSYLARLVASVLAVGLGMALAGAIVLDQSVIRAQAALPKPDFTGKWTLVPNPNAPTPGGGAVGGTEVTVTQDATTLTVGRMQGQIPYTLTYKLDGSEDKNTIPGPQGAAGVDVIAKVTWEGNKLSITSTQTMQMQDQTMTMSSKQALSLAADGTMLVENTRQPMGGADPVTTKATYRKNGATVHDHAGMSAQEAPKPPEFTITLTTKPSPPVTGTNDFEVTVQGPDKKPIVGADVSVTLAMPAMPGMGSRVVVLKAAEGTAAAEGKYVGQGRVSMGGRWEGTITVKIGGKDVAEMKVPFVSK